MNLSGDRAVTLVQERAQQDKQQPEHCAESTGDNQDWETTQVLILEQLIDF